MRARNYFSILASTAVLTITGAAFSGPSSVVISLMDFDESTGELLGYQHGVSAPSSYRHTLQTIHLEGIIGQNQHPPGPCVPLTHVWNSAVSREAAHPNDGNARLFIVLLNLLARDNCSVVITPGPGSSTTGGDIGTIAPSN